MKQSFFVLLFTLVFALAAIAAPQQSFFRGQRGGRKNKGATTTTAATTAANTIVGGAAAATTTTSAAGANVTAAADTGNNANFNSIALDGQPNAQPCNGLSNFPPTNGQQLKAAGQNSCSNTQQGEIPDVNNMVSTVILTPQNGQTMPANTAFTVSVKTQGMNLGFFDDPNTQYYLFSQQLDKSGKIMGHQHVTIQQIGDPTQPLDPKAFSFFKGLNDIDNNGVLSVAVANGLPAGNYRLCTMTGAFGHQPVIMPVAQRGAQDDCIRFTCQ